MTLVLRRLLCQDAVMGEIVNLNRARKRLARARDAMQARENRIRFGRTTPQKLDDARTEAERVSRLDGKRRRPAEDAAPPAERTTEE